MIVRRERPHPGAQLSFTDHDGYRFQAILTDQPDGHRSPGARHRQRARVEDRIRDDKDTGLAKLPFKEFALNEVWVEIVMLAHDLLIWTQALALDGELARAEPKRLRYRLLHIAARLAFSGRQAKLHLQTTWPWTPSSPPRLRNSTRCPPPPAKPRPPDTPAQQTPPAPAAIIAARTRAERQPSSPAKRAKGNAAQRIAGQQATDPRQQPHAVTLARLLHVPG